MTVARIASEDARAICMREYGSAPDVDIYGDPDFTFPQVPILNACYLLCLIKGHRALVQDAHVYPVTSDFFPFSSFLLEYCMACFYMTFKLISMSYYCALGTILGAV